MPSIMFQCILISVDTFFGFGLTISMHSMDSSHTLQALKDHICFLSRFLENIASDNSPGIYAQATHQLAQSRAYSGLSMLQITPNPQGYLSILMNI